MKFIAGKKIDMDQVWQGEKVVAVTRVKIEPCKIVQIKDKDTDGYESVQIGIGQKKEKNINKPQKGHMKDLGNFRYLREFKIEAGELKKGDTIDIETFSAGDKIKVIGISKGKGFQGVVKRHGFKGSKKTHGNKDQLRMPGSIGSTGPAHVFKGVRMAGRMGGDRTTVSNLEIVDVNKEENILLIKGALPGARNGLILIQGEGELKVASGDEKVNAEIADKEIKSEEEKVPAERTVDTEVEEKKDSDVKKEEEKKEDIEKVVEDADKKVKEEEKKEDDNTKE